MRNRSCILHPIAKRYRAYHEGVRVFALGLSVLFLATTAGSAPAAATPPNIVFILADDLGYGDLSCYGRPDFRTPAIDRIAERGVRFTQAYASAPLCSPTRLSLMTGRYPHRLPAGLEETLYGGRDVELGLPPGHPTLPSLLRRVGYRTMLVGKWHLGLLPKFGPLQSGYDRFFGFRKGATDFFLHGVGNNDGLWVDDNPVRREGYLTDLLGQRAVEAIGEFAQANAPFLLSLHFNAPHWPWEGPDDEAEAKRLHDSGLSIEHFDGGSQRTYREMVESMDRQIGRVLAAWILMGSPRTPL